MGSLHVGSLLAAHSAWQKSYAQRCVLLLSHHHTPLAVKWDFSLQGGTVCILKIFCAKVGLSHLRSLDKGKLKISDLLGYAEANQRCVKGVIILDLPIQVKTAALYAGSV